MSHEPGEDLTIHEQVTRAQEQDQLTRRVLDASIESVADSGRRSLYHTRNSVPVIRDDVQSPIARHPINHNVFEVMVGLTMNAFKGRPDHTRSVSADCDDRQAMTGRHANSFSVLLPQVIPSNVKAGQMQAMHA
jgi:hypothetical protein